jgi:hypothetical protein
VTAGEAALREAARLEQAAIAHPHPGCTTGPVERHVYEARVSYCVCGRTARINTGAAP